MRIEHPGLARVAAALRAAGARGEIREFGDPVPTAAAAASQLGCDVGAIANSLVFAAKPHPTHSRSEDVGTGPDEENPQQPRVEAVLVLTSGAHRVDTAKVATLLGVQQVRRADAGLVRTATGFPIGGVSPVGHPSPLRTLVDETLRDYDVVWASAGHPNAVFATTFDELVDLTGGVPAQVG